MNVIYYQRENLEKMLTLLIFFLDQKAKYQALCMVEILEKLETIYSFQTNYLLYITLKVKISWVILKPN